MGKICNKCGTLFEPYKKRGSVCKECNYKQDRVRDSERKAQGLDYYSRHKEEVLARCKEYYAKNRDACLARNKAYQERTGKNRKYYAENRDYWKERAAKLHRENPGRKYGLAKEEYWKMVEDSKGLCSACGEKMEKMCVDHNHETEKVRGLICSPCNFSIGFVRDDPERAIKLAEYLRKNETR